MPGLDGTGPRGQGPLTGRGDGYCAVRLPSAPGQPAVGCAGLPGRPVRVGALPAWPRLGTRLCRWLRPFAGRRRGMRRGMGWGRGRRW
jgi:hypothetical protein